MVEFDRSTISTPSPVAHALSESGNDVGEWNPHVHCEERRLWCSQGDGWAADGEKKKKAEEERV